MKGLKNSFFFPRELRDVVVIEEKEKENRSKERKQMT
jgi:hypothetical protein